MNRDQWLAERKSGIGGSDVAAILGLSPYKTLFEVWLEKTNAALEPSATDELERVQFGRLMEDIIAREYARREGVKVRRRHELVRHARYPWMIANPDRLIEGRRCGLECKNVDAMAFRLGDWGEPGTDQAPDEYVLQCQHYMIVLDYPVWHLAACVGGNRLVTFVIERDAELADMLIDAEHDFWQHVETRRQPDIDYGHPSTRTVLARLYSGTNGETIQLGDDIAHWHHVKEQADRLAKQYDDVSKAARNHIIEAIGPASIGRLPDGSAYRRKVIERKEYTVEAATYVDCRHVKAKDKS
ncbi:YqaJ viral recombinase family protein [Burkholderia pseudomallei]|uniref:YqaJ viral recombinase family nuclease n=1 Tax=Burkholderia pseudomallei TaxID=28450 RepID=UPI000A1A0CD4|nr:YqaJ viral recombinase family protein [Burkholderia pseudomallei]ARK56279.1 endonuclease [Burkholderia pseudomallei]ARL25462.1 endonuclease [Burkholderia pseudomallei]ARL77574.1 endonuclease [Burkholderia pseudomallei]ARL84179.1 endonuclease [Burkholderia pseudomallei]